METAGGYAKETSDDYKKQSEMMREALKKMILSFAPP